jgi:hypothetical protein
MRNTTKLRLILQLYNVALEMDEDDILYFTLIDKKNGESQTFIDKSYTVVIRKAFMYINKNVSYLTSNTKKLTKKSLR